MPNPQNLTPWKKGHKHAPGNGRPKGSYSIVSSLQKIINREIEIKDPFSKKMTKGQMRDFLALRLVAEGLNGNIKAIQECFDRLDGKALQKIEQNQTIDVNSLNLKGLTDETLAKMLKENAEEND